MKNHRATRLFLSLALSLLAVAVGGMLMLGGCKQSEGERCQVASDCESGLECNIAKDPPACQGKESGTAIDALPPLDILDGPPDGPPDAPLDAPPDV